MFYIPYIVTYLHGFNQVYQVCELKDTLNQNYDCIRKHNQEKSVSVFDSFFFSCMSESKPAKIRL